MTNTGEEEKCHDCGEVQRVPRGDECWYCGYRFIPAPVVPSDDDWCRVRIAINTESGPSSYPCGQPKPCTRHYTATACCTDPQPFATDNGKRQCATCGTTLPAPPSPSQHDPSEPTESEYGEEHMRRPPSSPVSAVEEARRRLSRCMRGPCAHAAPIACIRDFEAAIRAEERQQVEALVAAIPQHKVSFTLAHNEPRCCYESVESYYGQLSDPEWVSEEQRAKAIANDEIWVAQWYPETPVGFNVLAAADLSALFAALRTLVQEDGDKG